MFARRMMVAMAVLAVAGAVRADWDLRARITCPGASVTELIERVTLPAERVVRAVTGVKQVDSVARPEVLTMTLRIAGNGADRRAVRLDVLRQLEDNRHHMSADISKIEVDDIYERTYPVIVAVSGKGTSMRVLKQYAKEMQDVLQQCPNVSGVKLMGVEDYVIALMIPKGHFAMSCSVEQLAKMLSGYLKLEAAGSMDVGSRRLRIAADDIINSGLKGGEDILDLPYTIDPKPDAQSEVVMLRDHIQVNVQRSTTPPESMTGVDGERCVLLAVSFLDGTSDSEVDGAIANAKAEAPLGIEIDKVYDAGARGDTAIFDLTMVEGVRIEATDGHLRSIARDVRNMPGVERVLSVAGACDIVTEPDQKIKVPAPNKGTLIVKLGRGTSVKDISRQMAANIDEKAPGAILLPRDRSSKDGFGVWYSEEVVSKDCYDGRTVYCQAERMAAAARAVPGVVLARSDWGEPIEFLRYELYESRVRQLCLTRSDISLACRTKIQGYPVTDCWIWGERLPVVLRVGNIDNAIDVQELSTTWAYSSALDRFIPFGQVVRDFESRSEIGCCARKNGRFVATVFVCAESDDAIKAVKRAWAELDETKK